MRVIDSHFDAVNDADTFELLGGLIYVGGSFAGWIDDSLWVNDQGSLNRQADVNWGGNDPFSLNYLNSNTARLSQVSPGDRDNFNGFDFTDMPLDATERPYLFIDPTVKIHSETYDANAKRLIELGLILLTEGLSEGPELAEAGAALEGEVVASKEANSVIRNASSLPHSVERQIQYGLSEGEINRTVEEGQLFYDSKNNSYVSVLKVSPDRYISVARDAETLSIKTNYTSETAKQAFKVRFQPISEVKK